MVRKIKKKVIKLRRVKMPELKVKKVKEEVKVVKEIDSTDSKGENVISKSTHPQG